MKNTIIQIPTRRYSLENTVALWRKTTASGRWYVVAPKGAPPARGWKKSMQEAVRAHRRKGAR